jgi:hypothetical protein
MTGTARITRSIWIILAVQLLGCIGTGLLIPNTSLTGITHTGQAGRDRGLRPKTAGRE